MSKFESAYVPSREVAQKRQLKKFEFVADKPIQVRFHADAFFQPSGVHGELKKNGEIVDIPAGYVVNSGWMEVLDEKDLPAGYEFDSGRRVIPVPNDKLKKG